MTDEEIAVELKGLQKDVRSLEKRMNERSLFVFRQLQHHVVKRRRTRTDRDNAAAAGDPKNADHHNIKNF